MRSHRRRTPVGHLLVAGELADVDAVRALLALQADDAFGQVFIEVGPGEQMPALPAPPRVSVLALRRPDGAEPGSLLCRAVDLWAQEWIPDESDPQREVSIWTAALVRSGGPVPGVPHGVL